MLHILAITTPIYLIVLLGWLAVRHGFFDKADLRVLGRFVVQFALPALLFKALASRPLHEVLDAGYLLAVALGSLAVFSAVFLYSRWTLGKPAAVAAMKGMGSSFSNTGYIGYPIALQFLGPVAGVALALNMLVENLLMLPLVLTLAESADGSGRRWWQVLGQTLAGLRRNPMVLAIVLGFGVAWIEVPLPAPLWKTIDMMALASTAVALFVVGGTLSGLSTRGLVGDVSRVALGKLIAHPMAVYAALWLVPATTPELRTLAVVMAAMPMLGIYPILAQKYGLEGPCAAALLGTTVASFMTLSAWLWLLGHGMLPWP
ncbi:MAG: AEC family transporter [Rubrivivax sp.]|nr:AEC family transporter [Rubrivivax sp.]